MKNIFIQIFILFTSITSSNAVTEEQTEYLRITLDHYESILQNSYDELTDSYLSDNPDCTFNRACFNNSGFGAYPINKTLSPDPLFLNLSTSRDMILFKDTIQDVELDDDDFNDICSINDLQSLWESNLENNPHGLAWQYVGMPNGLFASYPYVDWEEVGQCPGSYKPELRPWYISGSSGQKNMIILLDISKSTSSSDTRVSLSIEIAKNFLATLSFRDFVSIIPYASTANPYDSNRMMRASTDDIYYLNYYLDNLDTSSSSQTNIGEAMQVAMEILQSSTDSGDTSDCTNTIILITGGENSENDIDPEEEIDNSDFDLTVFSFIVSPYDDEPARLTPTRLACNTGGIVQIYTGDEIDPYAPVEVYDTYLSSGINNQVVRWSEPYDDAMGIGSMITGARPFYTEDSNGVRDLRSVLSLDLLMENVTNNGNISYDDVLAHLVNEQVCEEFSGSQGVKYTYMEENVCEDINDDEFEEDPEYVRLYGLIVTCNVLFVISITIGPIIYIYVRGSGSCAVLTIGLVALFVPGLIYLSTFHAITWDEVVRYHNWKEATVTVEAKEENPYRCCDIVNCECANTNANSCSSKKASLVEGTCGNGYYCCKRVYYECNCYYTTCGSGDYRYRCRSCSTCSYCDKDVNNRKCEVVCGTCYTPTVTVSYRIDGDGDGYESLIEADFSDSCSRDQHSCPQNFLDEYPSIGGTFQAYYNPSNPTEIGESTDYTIAGISVAPIFGIITLAMAISEIVLCVCITKNRYY